MKQLILVGAGLISFCAGCAPQVPLSATIQAHFSGKSLEVLNASVADIEREAGSPFMHDSKSEYEIDVRFGELDSGTLGQTLADELDECAVVINDSLISPGSKYSDADLRHVFIHELGHCFGLMHNADPMSMMYWVYNPLQNTAKSLREFARDINMARGVTNECK